jgi:hypothetical protein
VSLGPLATVSASAWVRPLAAVSLDRLDTAAVDGSADQIRQATAIEKAAAEFKVTANRLMAVRP